MSPISVNGVAIPESAIHMEMQHHPADTADEAQAAAARALVVRELLRQEAVRQAIEATDSGHDPDEARIDALLAKVLELPEADEAACRRYYEANRQRFRSPDLFEAAHILVTQPTDEPARRAREAALAQALRLLDLIDKDPSCFAALARAHSACPSAASGGNLGQLQRGSTVPAFEKVMMAMQPGSVHPAPVETRYGFHLIRLDRRIDGRQLPFEAVHTQVAGYLTEAVFRRAVSQYLRVLAGQAEIEGFDLHPADGPLLQ